MSSERDWTMDGEGWKEGQDGPQRWDEEADAWYRHRIETRLPTLLTKTQAADPSLVAALVDWCCKNDEAFVTWNSDERFAAGFLNGWYSIMWEAVKERVAAVAENLQLATRRAEEGERHPTLDGWLVALHQGKLDIDLAPVERTGRICKDCRRPYLTVSDSLRRCVRCRNIQCERRQAVSEAMGRGGRVFAALCHRAGLTKMVDIAEVAFGESNGWTGTRVKMWVQGKARPQRQQIEKLAPRLGLADRPELIAGLFQREELWPSEQRSRLEAMIALGEEIWADWARRNDERKANGGDDGQA